MTIFAEHFILFVSQGVCLVKTKQSFGLRSSRPEVFCKKGILRKFEKFRDQRWSSHLRWSRSNNQRCSVRIGVLRKFAKFTGKHLCLRIFLNKVVIKEETLAQVFSCKFCELFKNTYSYRTPLVAASLVCCHLFHKKWGLQSLQIYF